tara:strand:- start:483 stop:2123 length:1641 start_codon:yes stop_codon:yes gene_type:complete
MQNIESSNPKKHTSFIPMLDDHIGKFVPAVKDKKNFKMVKYQGDLYFRNKNEHDFGNFLVAVDDFSNGDSAGAVQRIRFMLKEDPSFAGAHHFMLSILDILKENELYEKTLFDALKVLPDNPTLLSLRGKFHLNQAEREKGIKYLEECLKKEPKNVIYWTDLGYAYFLVRNIQMACLCLETALSISQNHPNVILLSGIILQEFGKHIEAKELYLEGLRLHPKDQKIINNLSLLSLSLGDRKMGFKLFSEIKDSQRINYKNLTNEIRKIKNLKMNDLVLNKSYKIFVYFEQGFGDYLMFYRYLKPLADLGHSITAFGAEDMIKLLKYTDIGKNVKLTGTVTAKEIKNFDFKTFIFNIPHLLNIEDEIPSQVSIDIEKIKKNKNSLQKKLQKIISKRKVNIGVSWKGNKKHPYDCGRSIDLKIFEKLFSIQEHNYLIIDKEINKETKKVLKKYKNVFLCDRIIKDWSDTAIIVSELDQIISVDTSLAHIGGTMNKPTTVLLGKPTDWRWGIDGNKTDWYNSVTLLRQKENNWEKLIFNLYNKLKLIKK